MTALEKYTISHFDKAFANGEKKKRRPYLEFFVVADSLGSQAIVQ